MSADHFVLRAFEYNLAQVLKNHNLEEQGKVQQYIDSEVLRLSEPMVPRNDGLLIQSGITNTNIGSGEVKYRTPYARRWYYMPANFQEAPTRGNYWFERMKEQYKDSILQGAMNLL